MKIGSDSNIEKYLVYVPEEHQKYKNDRDGDKFHLTVLLPDEMKSISISNYKIDYEKDINVYVFGISENIDCYYLVCGCPVADNLRKQLKLPSKQFHITLGFKGKDNHTLNKNIRSITKEDDNIIKNVISSVQHNENHKKNVEQIAELFERYPDNPDVEPAKVVTFSAPMMARMLEAVISDTNTSPFDSQVIPRGSKKVALITVPSEYP